MTSGMVIAGFILQALIFLGVLFKVYTDMQVRLKELELRVHTVEGRDNILFTKLDRIETMVNDIRIEMKDKQDRE